MLTVIAHHELETGLEYVYMKKNLKVNVAKQTAFTYRILS